MPWRAKTELATVRRHLETGDGLLLVTGEAGLAKTKLVTTAVALVAVDVFVATGSCLPLSSEAPLRPVRRDPLPPRSHTSCQKPIRAGWSAACR